MARIKQAGVLRVASDLSYPPLAFREGSAPRGFEIDLAGLMAAALGVRLEVINTPRAQLRPGSSDADLLIGALPDEVAPGLTSDPYYTMSQAILWRERAAPASDGILRNVRVAVQAKSPGEAVAKQLGAGSLFVTYLPMDALHAVSRGNAQAAVADLPLVLEYARTHRRLQVTPGRWSETPLVVVVARPDAADLLAFISVAIRELERTGGLAQLRQRWHL